MAETFDREYWEDRYRGHDHGKGGHPNPRLVAEVADLTPGTALDAGAGTGADAQWLAARGWTVTAVDISRAALDAARERAGDLEAGAAERITWVRADLTEEIPGGGGFDLVSSHYVHPTGGYRAFFDRLASAVAPGGTLLIVGHDPAEAHGHTGSLSESHVSAQEIASGLDPGVWEVVVAESRRREVERGGRRATMHDAVLRARRRG
ncbi:class I SAM-dependent methyltransferase [Nocardiopsis lambiniae]|uniref:Class I SAM-dependent methyltransferase n=1 Tax=Nocardiopsis lambiniae TaxID=3075539 RepID=A0ABU2MG76_9ACTN|nr:class I SAM-dependent methyltransferase [Nocardiopsis sp. DSM 44743]MDT0331569.1 class I SAM-dependent methyltransferase [Nocardiopsis sp. DSM 44743]